MRSGGVRVKKERSLVHLLFPFTPRSLPLPYPPSLPSSISASLSLVAAELVHECYSLAQINNIARLANAPADDAEEAEDVDGGSEQPREIERDVDILEYVVTWHVLHRKSLAEFGVADQNGEADFSFEGDVMSTRERGGELRESSDGKITAKLGWERKEMDIRLLRKTSDEFGSRIWFA